MVAVVSNRSKAMSMWSLPDSAIVFNSDADAAFFSLHGLWNMLIWYGSFFHVFSRSGFDLLIKKICNLKTVLIYICYCYYWILVETGVEKKNVLVSVRH